MNERKQYKVHLRFQHPAWDEVNGYDYFVQALSKAQAVKFARSKAYADGHTIGKRVYFTASEPGEVE